jgi:hypothetical protein
MQEAADACISFFNGARALGTTRFASSSSSSIATRNAVEEFKFAYLAEKYVVKDIEQRKVKEARQRGMKLPKNALSSRSLAISGHGLSQGYNYSRS